MEDLPGVCAYISYITLHDRLPQATRAGRRAAVRCTARRAVPGATPRGAARRGCLRSVDASFIGEGRSEELPLSHLGLGP